MKNECKLYQQQTKAKFKQAKKLLAFLRRKNNIFF